MALKLFKRKHHHRHHMPEDNRNPHYEIITITDPTNIASESYRRAKVAINYNDVDKHIQTIQVCSATQGEGKTVTLLNIAAAYVEDKKKVIIVDLDFRRPRIHRAFRIENKNGITDYLLGNISYEDVIKHSEYGLDFINRGSEVPFPTSVLESRGMRELFEKLKAEYDVILVDCPPILAVSDAVVVSKMCDGCLFVVSQSKSEKGLSKEAVKALREGNVNVLGSILVNASTKAYKSKYKYYYRYYSQYTDKNKEESK